MPAVLASCAYPCRGRGAFGPRHQHGPVRREGDQWRLDGDRWGWPLYTFVKDKAPGDVAGEGVKTFGGTWYAVSPSGKPVIAPATTSPPTSSSGSGGGGGYGY